VPIFVVWLLVITVAGGAAYWLGVHEEQELTAVVAAVSVPYWLWGGAPLCKPQTRTSVTGLVVPR
jgi:hypothetical protein